MEVSGYLHFPTVLNLLNESLYCPVYRLGPQKIGPERMKCHNSDLLISCTEAELPELGVLQDF